MWYVILRGTGASYSEFKILLDLIVELAFIPRWISFCKPTKVVNTHKGRGTAVLVPPAFCQDTWNKPNIREKKEDYKKKYKKKAYMKIRKNT